MGSSIGQSQSVWFCRPPWKFAKMTLYELTLPHLWELLDVYRTKAAASNANRLLAENILGNYIMWLEKDTHVEKLHIYSYNYNFCVNGMYMIVDMMNVMVNSLLKQDPDIVAALKGLRWHVGMKIIFIPENQYRSVYHCARRYPWQWRAMKFQIHRWHRSNASLWNAMPVPPGFGLHAMDESYAHEVERVWPHIGPTEYIARLLRYNMSVCMTSLATGDIVAWCLQRQHYFLGFMYVNPKYRQHRNIMKLLLNTMVRQMTESGLDVYTASNRPTRAMRQHLSVLNFMPLYQVHHLKSFNVSELNDQRIMMHAMNVW